MDPYEALMFGRAYKNTDMSWLDDNDNEDEAESEDEDEDKDEDEDEKEQRERERKEARYAASFNVKTHG